MTDSGDEDAFGIAGLESGANLSALSNPVARVFEIAEKIEQNVLTDVASSLRAAERLCALVADVPHAISAARAHRCHAHVLAYSTRFSSALESAERAMFYARKAGNRLEVARVQMTQMHVLARLGRFDEAIETGNFAYRVFLECGEVGLSARVGVNIGVTHRMHGDPGRALEWFNRARDSFQGDLMASAQLDSNVGEALMELRRYGEAESAFSSALRHFRMCGADRAAAIVAGNIGDLLVREGRVSEALIQFECAISLFRAGDSKERSSADLARLCAEHGEALTLAGAWDDAVSSYRESLPMLRTVGLRREEARALQGLAAALMQSGLLDEADEAVASARNVLRELGQVVDEHRATVLSGIIARRRGELNNARDLLIIAMNELSPSDPFMPICCIELAQIAIQTGNHAAGEAMIVKAMKSLSKHDNVSVRSGALHVLSQIRRSQNRHREAVELLQESVDQIELIRGSLQALRLRAMFLASHLSTYELLVQSCIEVDGEDKPARAFLAAEASRGRTLLDLVATSDAGVEGDAMGSEAASLLGEVRGLRAEVNERYRILGGFDEETVEDGVAVGANRSEHRLAEAERRLLHVRQRSAFAPDVSNLSRVAAVVPVDGVLVSYYFAEQELLAFVVKRGRQRIIRLRVSRKEVEESVRRLGFHRSCVMAAEAGDEVRRNRTREDLLGYLQHVYTQLLGSLSEQLEDSQRLTIVPHGPLHGVPFHALHDGRRFLIESHIVTYCPSGSIYASLMQRPQQDRREATVLIAGVADDAAPFIDAELALVGQRFPGAAFLAGEDATRQAVCDAMHGRSLVHLASHGRFNRQKPQMSGLRMADGWLLARDLAGIRLDDATVVLTGCETGRAAASGGDELVGFVRALFAAGAREVVLSQWRVSDQSTMKLVDFVYSKWQYGRVGVGPIVRGAQLQLLRDGHDPTHWAPFTVGGVA